MATPYFRQIPNFRYVSRLENSKIGEYIDVKNLFKRAKLNDNIFESLVYFEKYQIVGDERPDNVAYNIYRDETLDWVVLLSNNILNVQTEWPLTQYQFDNFLLNKYGSYENVHGGIHHYETIEIRNSLNSIVLDGGIWQPNNNTSFDVIDKSVISSVVVLDESGNNKKVFVTTTTPLSTLAVGTELLIEGVSNNSYNGRFTVDELVVPLGSQPTYLDLLPLNSISEVGDVYVTTIPDKQLWIFTGEDWINLGPAFYEMIENKQTLEFESQIVSSFIIDIVDNNPNQTTTVSSISLGDSCILNRISSSDYLRFYDPGLDQEVQIPSSSYIVPVTNYQYESKVENDKRNIFLLKPQYLNIIVNNIEDFMDYKKGTAQYVNSTLKMGENIRLYS